MPQRFDVCNGDADGLCAAVQWALARPGPLTLVTGLKRELSLLERVDAAAGDEVNVFDIALSRNRAALGRLLQVQVRVRYFDHHDSGGAPPEAPLFESHIDAGTELCTSLLVDACLGGAYRGWSLVGAYGDNLVEVADRCAADGGYGAADCHRLRRLGEAINYNAYGEHERDVRIAPQRLYWIMMRYRDPLDMLLHEGIVGEIEVLRQEDIRRALGIEPQWRSPTGSVLLLPDAPWSRRVMGTLANELANAEPQQAHAVLKRCDGGYVVSVRAPLRSPHGAHAVCTQFGGAGRARAAGIDKLPEHELQRFTAAFATACWDAPRPADSAG